MKRLAVLALAAASLLIGCDHNEYEIVITPKGGRMVRKLTVARLDTVSGDKGKERKEYKAFGREELAAIAAIYRAPVPGRKQDRYVFEATFEGGTPQDVGGAGSYTRLATPMGSVHYYCERFRGSDDQAAGLQQSFQAIDRLLDILVGWLKSELGKEKDFDKLHTLLDRDLRKDLKNLSLTLWIGMSVPRIVNPDDKKAKEAIEEVCQARVVQYMIERNYFQPSDVPGLFRTLAEAVALKQAPRRAEDKPKEADAQATSTLTAKQQEALRRVLKQLLSVKAGVRNEKLISKIASLLADDETALGSLLAYYAKTDHFARIKDEWKKEKPPKAKEKGQEEPDPAEVLSDLAQDCAPGEILSFGTDDKVTVRLNLPAGAFATNGSWDPKARQLTWAGRVKAREDLKPAASQKKDRALPMICYAAWSEENAEFQKRHFGKVILAGQELGEYCLWRKGLTKAEAAKWDQFLAGLKPDQTLPGKIKAFRFQPLKPGQTAADHPDYAQQGTERLLGTLQRN